MFDYSQIDKSSGLYILSLKYLMSYKLIDLDKASLEELLNYECNKMTLIELFEKKCFDIKWYASELSPDSYSLINRLVIKILFVYKYEKIYDPSIENFTIIDIPIDLKNNLEAFYKSSMRLLNYMKDIISKRNMLINKLIDGEFNFLKQQSQEEEQHDEDYIDVLENVSNDYDAEPIPLYELPEVPLIPPPEEEPDRLKMINELMIDSKNEYLEMDSVYFINSTGTINDIFNEA